MPRHGLFSKISKDTVDVDKIIDPNSGTRIRSQVSQFILDERFIAERTIAGGRLIGENVPFPETGLQAERIREIQLRNPANPRIADPSVPAPNDLNVAGGSGDTTQERVSGTAKNPIGASGRKQVTGSEAPKIVPLPQAGNRVPEIPENVLNDYINLQYH